AFDQAVRADPRHVQAASARAAMLHLLGRRAEAWAEYERARALAPDDARIVVNLGIVLEESGRPQDALARYDEAVALDPDCFAARLNRSALRLRLGMPEQALEDAERAARIDPSSAGACWNKAQALLAADRCEEALVACRQALERDPRHVGAHFCRALALACLGQLTESGRAFAHARALDPQACDAMVRAAYAQAPVPAAAGTDRMPDPRVIYLVRGVERLARCDWSGRERFLERFAEIVRDGARRGEPVRERSLVFSSMFLPLASDVVRSLAVAVADQAARAAPRLPALAPRPRGRGEPLRVGILSAGFRRHPNAFLLAPVVQALDRRRVRAFGYVLNPPDASAEARWLAASFDAVRMAHALDDAALARQIRADGIDILLDVSSGFDHARPAVLAARPAPLCARYLGALVPSGGAWIDYRIGDAAGMSDAGEFAPEHLVRLARACWTYATGPLALGSAPSRSEVGLPRTGAVLCAFGGPYKLDPTLFAVWMRVLAAVPGSVLWLLGDGAVERNLKAEAARLGVAPERLVFAPRVG
ncbi:MAG TPA: tetratricopeptide repeat protein, partial [Myxococcota bacterium]